jgi:hypothetical protein
VRLRSGRFPDRDVRFFVVVDYEKRGGILEGNYFDFRMARSEKLGR